MAYYKYPPRKQFLALLGEYYENFGLPRIVGWIEGLLLLEPGQWSQQAIADRLTEIFPQPDFSTSVSSVNRAIKVLEEYGAIIKSGSRKAGFQYEMEKCTSIICAIFTKFEIVTQQYLYRSMDLQSKEIDSQLEEVIDLQKAEYTKITDRLSSMLQLT